MAQLFSIIEIMTYPPPKVNRPIFTKVKNNSIKILIPTFSPNLYSQYTTLRKLQI